MEKLYDMITELKGLFVHLNQTLEIGYLPDIFSAQSLIVEWSAKIETTIDIYKQTKSDKLDEIEQLEETYKKIKLENCSAFSDARAIITETLEKIHEEALERF